MDSIAVGSPGDSPVGSTRSETSDTWTGFLQNNNSDQKSQDQGMDRSLTVCARVGEPMGLVVAGEEFRGINPHGKHTDGGDHLIGAGEVIRGQRGKE